ncbi:MAG: hypothetical protein MJZ31_00370 [Bacteroidales bacterium]|nr:hypothetical protein [Bacteroidales bacterium]
MKKITLLLAGMLMAFSAMAQTIVEKDLTELESGNFDEYYEYALDDNVSIEFFSEHININNGIEFGNSTTDEAQLTVQPGAGYRITSIEYTFENNNSSPSNPSNNYSVEKSTTGIVNNGATSTYTGVSQCVIMQFGSIQNVNLTHIKVTYVKTELVSNVNITTKAGCFPAVGEKFWNSSERDNKLTMVSSDVAYFGTATWYDTDKKTVLNSSSTVEEEHTYYLKVNVYTLTSSGYDYDKGAKATVDGKEYPIDIYNAIYVEYTTPVISGYGDDNYIVSYTNTFFDSGYVPTEKTMIVTKMRPMSDAGAQKVGSKTEDGFFGVVNSGSEVSWKRNNGNHDFLEIFQDVKYSGKEGSAANGATYTFVLKQGEFNTYIEKDGEMELYQTKTWTPAAFQKGEATMYIGAVNDAKKSNTWRSNALIYFFDIYEDGVLVKHFVPDFNNGEYCLYDNKNYSYAMNIGSGEVVACTGEHHYADVTVSGVTQRMCLICGEKVPIAQMTIGETTTEYYDAVTLINAVFACQETASVKLLADINLGNGSLTISKKDTEVVLDLNGHSLNGAVMTSNNNAHLIICDNSEEQTGSIVSSNIPVIAFASTSITINGGTFVGKTAIYLDDESSVTLDAGKFDVVEKTLDYASENATITLGEGKALKLADNTILTKITGNVEQSSEVIDAPSTPTAIESINADKAQKAVKTIENGKVVIIRGDKKYDLSGRVL